MPLSVLVRTSLCILVLSMFSCGAKETSYPLRGKVITFDPQNRRVSVAHEEIPGYMEAMTMTFRIKEGEPLPDLRADVQIEATLVVSDGRSWIQNVRIIPKGKS